MSNSSSFWAIWDKEHEDWLSVDEVYVQAYFNKESAESRAAKFWGYRDYQECFADGWCEVVELTKRP